MKTVWSLDALYTGVDSPEFLEDWNALPGKISELDEFAAKAFLSWENAGEKIERFITLKQDIYHSADILGSYFHLLLATDSTNSDIGRYADQYDSVTAELSAGETAFKEFVGGLKDLSELIESSSFLTNYRFYLERTAAASRHSGTQEQETLLAKLSSTGSTAWGNQVNMLTSTLKVDIALEDQPEQITLSAVRNLAFDPSQNIRKTAYEAELAAYPKIDQAIVNSLNAIKGEAELTANLRKHGSVLDMTLFDSRMDQEILTAMWSAIEDAFPDLRAYLSRKSEMLGHKNGLPFYDLFAPVGNADMAFTYEEAADTVIKAFSAFSPVMGEYARHAFENQWIDVYSKDGKTGGAFCATIRSIQQCRILTNFSGSFDSVNNLAHELGHAYHSRCLFGVESMNSYYPMPIAETASTFAERLLIQESLKTATPEQNLAIIENYLMGVTQVVVDIYSRYLFESRFIAERKNGPLSVEETKELMLGAQRDAYGEGLDPDLLHPYMWLCKPHYYEVTQNFYNFPYAYGQLFSLGLYAQYEAEGEAFIPKYEALLAATGKNDLWSVGQIAGIDVRDKAFWASSLAMISEDVKKFLELSKQ